MEYHFLNKWIDELNLQSLEFKSMTKFEDQFFIQFAKNKGIIQVNFSSENSFCFFTKEKELVYASENSAKQTNIHLSKAKLLDVKIDKSDRIITLSFEKIDIYNERIRYELILEIVPRYQNWILIKLDGSSNIIIDCWRKISFAENRHRQILPGAKYQIPPTDFIPRIEEVTYPLKLSDNKIKFSEEGSINNMNIAFESLFYDMILQNRIDKIKRQKIKIINKKIKSKLKKIENMKNDLSSKEQEIRFKQFAELLNGYFAQIKRGMKSIVVTDYFNEPYGEVEIKLNPEKSPEQNISIYSKKYRKARDGRSIIGELIEKTHNEIEMFEREIFEIEAIESYLDCKAEQKEKISNKEKQMRSFKKIKINDEWEILVGRTSRENDQLTTRIAKKYDWWFHTRVFQGTHVILRNFKKQELPEDLRVLCCGIAAYFSKAKKSSNVPVDYTQVRYVRKPKSSPPGYVIYTDQKTLYIDPLSFRDAAKWVHENYLK